MVDCLLTILVNQICRLFSTHQTPDSIITLLWSIENKITGPYHITNNDSICKYDLLKLFKKYTGKEIDILPIDGKEVDKSFIDTRKLIDYKIPSYEQMVLEMTNLIRSNKVLYSQYTV